MFFRCRFLARFGFLLLIAALAAPAANATDFTWTGFDDNDYFNYLNWLPFDPGVITGPPGTNDTATIDNGDYVTVTDNFTSQWFINGLTLSGGSHLDNDGYDFYAHRGYEVVVDGGSSAETTISGSGTELIVWENLSGPSADGFDTDLMTINFGGKVSLGHGRLEVDSGLLDINLLGELRGYGWVDLEANRAATFTALENDGLIHVYGYGTIFTPAPTLTVTTFDADARVDLDGFYEIGAVQIDENGWLGMNAPLTDAFDGDITMGRNTVFQMTDGWINGTGGIININAGTGTAAISVAAPNTFTNNGTINVNSGTLVMAANYVDNGTTIHVNGTGLRLLGINNTINNPDFNGAYHLEVGSGSDTTINAGPFNWDGSGSATTTIENGGHLTLDVDSVDLTDNLDNGTLNLQGSRATVNLPGSDSWTMAGTINALASAAVSRIDGSPVRVTGTVNVAVGATLDLGAFTTVAPTAQFNRGDNSILSFSGGGSIEGDFDLDGPDDNLTVTIGDGQTLTMHGAINNDSVRPDTFHATMRLEGGTFDVSPTAIDPLMIFCDPDKPSCDPTAPPEIVFNQVSNALPSVIADGLLLKYSKVTVESGTGVIDAPVETTPDAILDTSLGDSLKFTEKVSAGGGEFIGRFSFDGGLEVTEDTMFDGRPDFDGETNDQHVLVRDGVTQTVNATNPMTFSGKWEVDSGIVDIGTTSIELLVDCANLTSTPGQIILKQTSANVPRFGGTAIELLVVDCAEILQEGPGEGIVQASLLTTTPMGSVKGNLTLDVGRWENGGLVSPGHSPGTIEVTGAFEQTASGHLQMELAGTTPGTEHDQILVGGQAMLGGALDVALIDGFTPSAGDVFDLFDWGSVFGTFDSVNLPALGVDLLWDTASLYTLGELQVVPAGIPGDYNNDGLVNAADYVLFRKNEGTTNLLANDPIGGAIGQGQYDQWRAHFGQTAGSGSVVHANASVPEPASAALAIICILGLALAAQRGFGNC